MSNTQAYLTIEAVHAVGCHDMVELVEDYMSEHDLGNRIPWTTNELERFLEWQTYQTLKDITWDIGTSLFNLDGRPLVANRELNRQHDEIATARDAAEWVMAVYEEYGFHDDALQHFHHEVVDTPTEEPQMPDTRIFIPLSYIEGIACIDIYEQVEEYTQTRGLLAGRIPWTRREVEDLVRFMRDEHGNTPKHMAWYIATRLIRFAPDITSDWNVDKARERISSPAEAADWVWELYEEHGFLDRVKPYLEIETVSDRDQLRDDLLEVHRENVADVDEAEHFDEPHQVREPTNGQGQAYIVNDRGEFVIFADGQMHVVPSDHPRRDEIQAALYRGQYEDAIDQADRNEQLARVLSAYDGIDSGLTIQRTAAGDVLLNGDQLNSVMAEKVFELLDAGLRVDPVLRFTQRLARNPDDSVKEQLVPFLQGNDFAIDSHGYIVAWKKVTRHEDGHLTDQWTRQLNYDPPRVVTMPRDSVVNDPSNSCAPGLHFATWEFTKNYGGDRVVEMRVDPADVVSVPSAHTDKGRACTLYIEREIIDWQRCENPPHYGNIHSGRVWPASVAVAQEAVAAG